MLAAILLMRRVLAGPAQVSQARRGWHPRREIAVKWLGLLHHALYVFCMRYRVLAIALLLVGTLLGSGLLRHPLIEEPTFQGRSLSGWLEEGFPYPNQEGCDDAETDNAVLQIGTNALPTLLRLLQARDSDTKLRVVGLLQKQTFVKVRHTPDYILNGRAACAFRLLGPKARSAVPALVEICDRNISFYSQFYTFKALGYIGPAARDAIPALVKWATNSGCLVRLDAIEALADIHAEPQRIVSALTNVLWRTGAEPTPLHWAVEHGQNQVVELLLASGADVNAKDDGDRTPLYIATLKGFREVAKLLLTNHADVNAASKGTTPLRQAKLIGDRAMAQLLRQYGGRE